MLEVLVLADNDVAVVAEAKLLLDALAMVVVLGADRR